MTILDYVINGLVFSVVASLLLIASHVRASFHDAARHKCDKHPFCNEARD